MFIVKFQEDYVKNFNLIQRETINVFRNCLENKYDYLVCIADKNLFLPAVLWAVHEADERGYLNRKDIDRRTSVLLITNRSSAEKYFENLKIYTDSIIELSSKKQNQFRKEGIFVDISNPKYTQCYWQYILNLLYDKQIPKLLPYHYFFPITTGRNTFNTLSRGERNNIGRKDNIQLPTYYITNNPNIFKRDDLPDFDRIFIDYSTIDEYVPGVPKGAYYFIDSLLDNRIRYIVNKLDEVFICEGSILQQYQNKMKTQDKDYINMLISKSNITNLSIDYVESSFEEEIESIIKNLKELKKIQYDHKDLDIMAQLLRNIIEIPVPAVKFDNYAEEEIMIDTISDLIEELKESENRYENNMAEEILTNLVNTFYKKKLDMFCPKTEHILKLIEKSVAKCEKIGILSSNKVINIALKDTIASYLKIDITELEENNITIINKKRVLKRKEVHNCDLLIIFSCRNISELRVLQEIQYNKSVMLLYKLEILQLKSQLEELLELPYNIALETIGDPSLYGLGVYRYLFNRIKKSIPKENQDIMIDFDLENLLEEIKINPIFRKNKDYKGKKRIEARLIEFVDGDYMFLEPGSSVKLIERSKRDLIDKNCDEIEVGNEVVFINNNVKQDLYEIFINSLDKDEEILKYYYVIQKWREIYEDKYISMGYTDEKLYNEMIAFGWDKISISILSNWRKGISFGPRDKADIEILGKVLNIKLFVDNAAAFHGAMKSIRNERRTASRILNQYIFSSKRSNIDKTKFIEKYNLNIDDVRQAIKIKKIKQISVQSYMVRPTETGVCFSINEGGISDE